MSRVKVNIPYDTYSIIIQKGLLEECGDLLTAAGFYGRCLVVTNPALAELYAKRLLTILEKSGFSPNLMLIPDGEEHKSLASVITIYEQLAAEKFERGNLIIGLGGGVITDIAGFAAATFMRGLPLINIPTTLLAMVDASIGGKTGVDLPAGKNLVGAFKQPDMVLIAPEVLETLPPIEFRNGLSEVVKAGIIGSPLLFRNLKVGNLSLPWLIEEAVKVKVAIVEADPFEKGRRAVLNLGHTFAHAYEMLSAYSLRHGQAVAKGILDAARLSYSLGYLHAETKAEIECLLKDLVLLPEDQYFDPLAVWEAMAIDKKRQRGKIRFILPRAIGDVDLFSDISREQVLAIL